MNTVTIPSVIQSVKQNLADAVKDLHAAVSQARLALGQVPPADPLPGVLAADDLPKMLGIFGKTSGAAVQAFADLREAVGAFVGGLLPTNANTASAVAGALCADAGELETGAATGNAHEQNGRPVVPVAGRGQGGRGRTKR